MRDNRSVEELYRLAEKHFDAYKSARENGNENEKKPHLDKAKYYADLAVEAELKVAEEHGEIVPWDSKISELQGGIERILSMYETDRKDAGEAECDGEDGKDDTYSEEYNNEQQLVFAREYFRDGDHKEAFEIYYDLAVIHGSAEGAYELGLAYFNGDGTEKDWPQALYWLSVSAKRGLAIAAEILNDMDGDEFRAAVCPWCDEVIIYDVSPKPGDLRKHVKCGKLFRFVDRKHSRRFGMEKCKPKSGVNPIAACPECGGKLNVDISNFSAGDIVTCPVCSMHDFNIDKDTILPGEYLYLDYGNFARRMVSFCEHCRKAHRSVLPKDLGLDSFKEVCTGCGKEYTYTN